MVRLRPVSYTHLAFSAGAAFALYVWLYLQRAIGWHASLVLAGVFELAVVVVTIAAFRVPDGDRSLGGVRFDRAALHESLTSRDLWIYGIALLLSLIHIYTAPTRGMAAARMPRKTKNSSTSKKGRAKSSARPRS